MMLSEPVQTILAQQHGMITSRQISTLPISRTTLSRYVKHGLLERVRTGVYTTSEGLLDDLLLMQLHIPYGVFSHGTALFLNGLTNQTPLEPMMTLPQDRVLTKRLRSEVKCFYVANAILDLGITQCRTPIGNVVQTYDAERTICDLIRSRNRLDDELVLDGLRQYAASPKKDVARLGEYAKRLGVLQAVKQTMEVVL